MRGFLAACLLFLTFSAEAAAQTGPNHAVPIFRGAGVSGFKSVGPCNAAVPIVGAGASTDPACHTSALGTMASQAASAVVITGGSITGMPSPSANSDVATKSYVDGLASGLRVLASSRLATAAALPNSPTYSNGASGVGRTLTAGSNSTLTVDGTVAALNDVVLVKDQASAFQNGIYTVTTAGSGGAAWVLTGATYFDQAAEMLAGSYTFVTAGATNINNAYVLATTITTVGTDAVTFNLFSTVSVSSVFSRTGVIAAQSGDYSVGQVTGAAPLASPTFTGVPAAPTASSGTNTTQLATTAFVTTAGTYTAPGTGGTAQTQARYNQNILWAHDYGAVCDGTTDDAAAFQNLINEAITLHALARFAGRCKINTALSITGTLDFGGTGSGYNIALAATGGGSTLLVAANINGININTDNPVNLSNFALAAAAATTGVGVQVTSSGTANYGTIFNGMTILAFNVNVHFIKAAAWSISQSNILSCVTYCVWIEDQFNSDAGDQFIDNSTLTGGSGSATLILYQSGGGLKISSTKFNTGVAGLELIWNGVIGSGLLLVTNSGFEGLSSSVILARSAGTVTGFSTINLSNNELSAGSGGYCVLSPTDAGGQWLALVTITSSTCAIAAGATAGFSLDSMGTFLVSNIAFATASSTAPRIALGTATSRGTIGPFTWDAGTYGANALNGNRTVTCSTTCN